MVGLNKSTVLVWGVLVLLVTTCAKKKIDNGGVRKDAIETMGTATPLVIWTGNGINEFTPKINNSGKIDSLTMALSTCECASKEVANLLKSDLTLRGTLPQLFVPDVRSSVANNPQLKALTFFSGGLGDAVKSLLASDATIAKEVRSGISEKVKNSLQNVGSTSLESRLAFRLDLFSPMQNKPNMFSVAEQTARWNLAWGRQSMWTGGAALDGVDHGLQFLEVLKVSAEWTYIAGLGGDALPNGYGGLAMDLRTGNSKLATPYNPVNAPDGSGLFTSGSFAISYPNASSVDMATKVKESWQFVTDNVPLATQARIWRAAAYGFTNMRFDRSNYSKAILSAPNGGLTVTAMELPLLWLLGMAGLLDNGFMDRNALVIHEFAYGDKSPAELESLLTLGEALQQWRRATNDIGRSGLSSSMQALLTGVPERLLSPLQLTVQRIISQHTFVTGADTQNARVYVGKPGERSPERLAAMTIQLLASLEQNELNSKELKLKVLSLFSSHAEEWVKSAGKNTDAATVIEQWRAAVIMSKYPDAPSWTNSLRDKLKTAVTTWGGI